MDIRHLLKFKSLLTFLLLYDFLQGCEAFQRSCSLDKEIVHVIYGEIDHSFHHPSEMKGTGTGSGLAPGEYYQVSARKCTCGHAVEDTYCLVERGENLCIAQWSWGSMPNGDESPHFVRCLKQSAFQTVAMLIWAPIYCAFLISIVSVVTTKIGRHWRHYIMHKCNCFPGINERLVEENIQSERRRRRQLRDAMGIHVREEREDGMIPKVSLHLKTKEWGGTSRSSTCSSDEESGGKHTINDGASSSEQATCSICMVEIEPGERVGALSCEHVFHADCLKVSWDGSI